MTTQAPSTVVVPSKIPPADPHAPHTPAAVRAPRDRKPRLVGLDLARGLAVLGMFVAHTAAHSAVGSGNAVLDAALGLSNGRPSILFALLAGISLGILTGRPTRYTGDDAVRARVRVLVRAVILLGVAGVLAILDTPVALILAFYAAWFMVVLPFAQRSVRWLFTTAALIAVFGPLLRWILGVVTPVLGLTLETGNVNQFFVSTLVSGVYPGLSYLAVVFAGLGLSRLDLGARRVQLRMVGVGALLAVLGYGVGLGGLMLSDSGAGDPGDKAAAYDAAADSPAGPASGIHADPMDPAAMPQPPGPAPKAVEGGTWEWFPTTPDADAADEATQPAGLDLTGAHQLMIATPHSGSTWEILGSGGFGIALTGLLLMLPAAAGRLLAPLAAVGSMSLTAYSAHVIALGLFPGMTTSASLWPGIGLVVGALGLCWAWRAAFGRRPLERLMYTASMRATR